MPQTQNHTCRQNTNCILICLISMASQIRKSNHYDLNLYFHNTELVPWDRRFCAAERAPANTGRVLLSILHNNKSRSPEREWDDVKPLFFIVSAYSLSRSYIDSKKQSGCWNQGLTQSVQTGQNWNVSSRSARSDEPVLSEVNDLMNLSVVMSWSSIFSSNLQTFWKDQSFFAVDNKFIHKIVWL